MNSLLNLFNLGLIDPEHKEPVMKKVLNYYNELDFNETPLLVNRTLHKMVREITNDPDPYKKLKDKYNNIALEYYEKYKTIIKEAQNPFDIAMRLSIAGNIIDFGPGHSIDVEKTINKVMAMDLAADQSKILQEEISKAKSILYLADNTGEIVFDKLFIETINHPNITVAVRQSPILNDATMEDIEKLEINKLVKVITNGDNAPGTLYEATSESFKEAFEAADLIISKGQGNYEGLNHFHEYNIFFLLMAKCNIVADIIGVKKGDCVVKKAGL